jgi:hypothetical protein
MLLKINGVVVPEDDRSWSYIKNTRLDTFLFGDNQHIPQFLGISRHHDAQQVFNETLVADIHSRNVALYAQIKTHVFDLHMLAQHMHDLMGMTS